ncbi:MAG: flagellar hook-length control protein FliK [Burkholderiaceae bacterium]|nr:flagellar hook-length control protein FliK [Burkholderiaceae bacterium]
MSPESLLNASILPQADRTATPGPARTHGTHVAAPTGSNPAISRGRRDEALASFGDAIARARREVEQQASRRTHERTAGDLDADAARASARNDDARIQSRNDQDARDRARSDSAARERARNDGTGRRRDEAGARDGVAHRAAVRDSAVRRPASRGEARDTQPSAVGAARSAVSREAAAPQAGGEAAASTAPHEAEAPALAGAAADVVAPTAADESAASGTSGSAPAESASPLPATLPLPPSAAPLAASPAPTVEIPTAEPPAGSAAAAAAIDGLVAAPVAAGAERLAHGAPRLAPKPAPDVAADPSEPIDALAPTPDTADAGAIDGPATVDLLSREAAAAAMRHAPGDAVGRSSALGSGTFAAATVGTAPQAPAAPQGTQPPTFGTIPTPLAHPAFTNHFAAEVASLALRGIERAEIVLNPKELGPVRIELSLNGETARVAFSAAQPETRQAIEQTLPILEDMLAEHGLMLSGSSVSDGRAGREPGGGTGRGTGEAVGAPLSTFDARQAGFPGAPAPAGAARGLVDLYA